MAVSAPFSVELLRAAARLYKLGLEAQRPLDAVVAHFLREDMAGRDDADRGFVVDAAQGLWRTRRLVEAFAAGLTTGLNKPSTERVVAASLISRGTPRDRLPLPRADVDAVARVVKDVEAAAAVDVRASLPPWLCDRLVRRGGEALALSSTQAPPQTLRANTLKTSQTQLLQTLNEEGFVVRACGAAKDGVVVVERGNVFRTAAFRDGLFEVQDEGSQLIALLAGAGPGMRVVDGCAGAGGKTLALACDMQNKGTLIALDVHGGRLKALKERCAKAGVHNVRVHDVEEEKKAVKRLKGSCDVVVVDAPCSGSGVLRRNPDTGWRLVEDDVARLVTLQKTLLQKYAALVKPGGALVYATCSLLDDENEAVVDAFLAQEQAFQVESARARLAARGVAVDLDGDGRFLRLDPVRHGTDGFFSCVLRRS